MEADEHVTVKFRASDDFGIRSVHLEVALGNRRPSKIKLWSGEAPRKDVLGRYEFDLRSMGIRPGGVLSYRFIAPDVDTVSGPKVGTSKTYRIRIRDREAVIADSTEIWVKFPTNSSTCWAITSRGTFRRKKNRRGRKKPAGLFKGAVPWRRRPPESWSASSVRGRC